MFVRMCPCAWVQAARARLQMRSRFSSWRSLSASPTSHGERDLVVVVGICHRKTPKEEQWKTRCLYVGIANGADPDVVDTQSCANAPSSLIRLIWWYWLSPPISNIFPLATVWRLFPFLISHIYSWCYSSMIFRRYATITLYTVVRVFSRPSDVVPYQARRLRWASLLYYFVFNT